MEPSTTNGIPDAVRKDIESTFKRARFWNVLTAFIVGISIPGVIVFLIIRSSSETFFNGLDMLVVICLFTTLFLHFKVHRDFERAKLAKSTMGKKI